MTLIWAIAATLVAASLGWWSLQLRRRLQEARASAWEEPTGVLTRRGLVERAQLEIARSARTKSPIGLLALDVDGLRRVNDRWGYEEGDRILAEVAGAVREIVREVDAIGHYGDVGRLGGEEFVVLLPDCDPQAAFGVAERVVRGVAERVKDKDGTAITVSAGATGLLAEGTDVDSLVAVGMSALREAKQRGPGRVVGAGAASAAASPAEQR
jgi:diguanylate cyclase (GGDEF)-like protein